MPASHMNTRPNPGCFHFQPMSLLRHNEKAAEDGPSTVPLLPTWEIQTEFQTSAQTNPNHCGQMGTDQQIGTVPPMYIFKTGREWGKEKERIQLGKARERKLKGSGAAVRQEAHRQE